MGGWVRWAGIDLANCFHLWGRQTARAISAGALDHRRVEEEPEGEAPQIRGVRIHGDVDHERVPGEGAGVYGIKRDEYIRRRGRRKKKEGPECGPAD